MKTRSVVRESDFIHLFLKELRIRNGYFITPPSIFSPEDQNCMSV